MREASAKRHCTVGEAVEVGRDMKAYRLILTHFSQRYPSVPVLPKVAEDYALLAFDFMRVSFQDLLWAPSIMPILIEAFPPGKNENDNEYENEYENESIEKVIGKSSTDYKIKSNDKKNDNRSKNENIDASSEKKRKWSCLCHVWEKDEIQDNCINDDSNNKNLKAENFEFKECTVCAPDNLKNKNKNKNKNQNKNFKT